MERLTRIAIYLMVMAFIGFGCLQLYAGFLGAKYLIGGWSFLVFVLVFLFRFMLPVAIGSFICALKIWGWPWGFALLFAAPGILLATPALVSQVVRWIRSVFMVNGEGS